MSKPDYTTMSTGVIIDTCGDDAAKWAEAFCQLKAKKKWKAKNLDWGLMHAWFSSAIEQACRVRRLKPQPSDERRNTHLCTGR